MFKIVNNKTGLFSKPGYRRWNKIGKIWNLKQHLSAHFATFRDPFQEYNDDDCEIIEYEMIEIRRIPIRDWIQGIVERRNDRADARQRAYNAAVAKRRYDEYLRLKKEFENG